MTKLIEQKNRSFDEHDLQKKKYLHTIISQILEGILYVVSYSIISFAIVISYYY
jgi:hypothetical protein